MVIEYIKDPRTIILAVLPANVDVATQEILALAAEYDKAGERTLGILTKPDLLKERSAKATVCELVLGNRKALNLGYYIVRNHGGDEDEDNSELAKRELLFRQHPWCELPDERVGLMDMLDETQDALNEICASRKTAQEQRQYLATMPANFQDLRRAALDADYSQHKAPDDPDLRLSTLVVLQTEWFDDTFRRLSQTYKFQEQKGLGVPR
ncbi:hypothetical protein QC762_0075580 [Podospora pseudocomata]|uniref:Dynamin N-terminal domain-containing protein n=1 Tax=Podospora pseudocomata TaxID=2093779 RepID=A0ABR0GA89_9PEZI|nr:hypothetical protein QC762_0075580 [Podospora pseudocomata]